MRAAQIPRNLAGDVPNLKKDAFVSRDSTAASCPKCGAAVQIPPEPEVTGYYSRARAWVKARPEVRASLGRTRAIDFRRIAKLNDPWGLRLDELGASYRMVRWTAGSGTHPERETRFRALVKLLEEHGAERDVGRRFAALVEGMPAVGRWAVRKGVAS